MLFRTRRREVEDTLAQLIHDDDQVIAAAAVHLAAERGIGTLADDLEYVLAHRDVRDWYVFEAASWALAGTRMAIDERRARWLEPLPAVEIVNRLRRIALFEHVSVDELFRLAGTGRQMRHGPRTHGLPAGPGARRAAPAARRRGDHRARRGTLPRRRRCSRSTK